MKRHCEICNIVIEDKNQEVSFYELEILDKEAEPCFNLYDICDKCTSKITKFIINLKEINNEDNKI